MKAAHELDVNFFLRKLKTTQQHVHSQKQKTDTDSVDTICIIVIREEPSWSLLSATDESCDQYHGPMARESRRDMKIRKFHDPYVWYELFVRAIISQVK